MLDHYPINIPNSIPETYFRDTFVVHSGVHLKTSLHVRFYELLLYVNCGYVTFFGVIECTILPRLIIDEPLIHFNFMIMQENGGFDLFQGCILS